MENTQTQTSTRKYVVIGIISVVVIVALFTTVWFIVKNSKKEVSVEVPKTKVIKEVTGTLLLSMLPKEIIGGMPLTFSIEPATSVFTPLFSYFKDSDGVFIFHTSLSPDKKLYVTGGTPSKLDPKNAANAVGLYTGVYDKSLVDLKNGATNFIFGNQKGSKGKVLRLPSINNDGGILYATAGDAIKEVNFGWEIHYSKGDMDVQVAKGLSPRWVSNTSFVYLSERGIRLFDLTKGSDSFVESVIDRDGKDVQMQPNMMMNVSRDGNQIALSNPEDHKIYLFAKSADKYVKNKEFNGFGFWPTFSPDGKILAVQTVKDLEKLMSDPSPLIVFWDIEDREATLIPKQIDLGNYQNDLLFITDWY